MSGQAIEVQPIKVTSGEAYKCVDCPQVDGIQCWAWETIVEWGIAPGYAMLRTGTTEHFKVRWKKEEQNENETSK